MRWTHLARIAFILATTAFTTRAQDEQWIPSVDGAYIEHIRYGYKFNKQGQIGLVLQVSLQGEGVFSFLEGDFSISSTELDIANSVYNSLVQAKADSLPVLLWANIEYRTFTRVIIGTVGPDFPLALHLPPVPEMASGSSRTGFDLLGRSRSKVSPRVPLVTGPTPSR